MADEKISALTSAGALSGTETLPIVQGGVTKKTTVQDVANLVTAGNANITTITAAALATLESTTSLSLTTIYIVTDAPIPIYVIADDTGQLAKTGSIVSANYSGIVNYDLATNTFLNGTIYDGDGNTWNGTLPSGTTLGASSSANVFLTAGTNTFGASARRNIIKQGVTGFILGDFFQNTTIEADIAGGNYTASPDYDFLYGNAYSSKIVYDGINNYHLVDDPANDRIVVTLMGAPFTVSYIGGASIASVVAGTNINVDNTNPANPIINSLADRYKTSSVTSNTIGNGSKTFTVDANLAYIPLQEVLIVNSPSNHMHGEVTSYSGTTLVVDVNHHTGSGTFASWVINLDGIPVDAITGVGTANEISYFTSGQVIASLPVATYPSLTELALVKGVTGSDIQTQINGKMTNPMTTGGDIIYGGSSGAPTRLANGTAGQILQSNGTTLAPSWVAAPSAGTDTQIIMCTSLIQAVVADATNYYIGIQTHTMTTGSGQRKFKFAEAKTLTKASLSLFQTVNASAGTVTIYLRNITTATDDTIGTFTSDFGAATSLAQLFTGLSIAVNATDNYEIKILTPTWTTNPTNWIPSLLLYLQ